MAKIKAKGNHKMSLFTLTMISSAFVISIRNFPMEAETGLHMLFFGLIAVIGFFLPVALVAAELATGWPKQGGIYIWVKEAFGDRLGFFSVWLQWNYMVIGVIAMLYFVGGSLAFVFAPALASNRVFLVAVLLAVIWGATWASLKGQKVSGIISSIGFLGGVLIPGLTIIALAAIYLIQGNPIQMKLSLTETNLIPNLSQITTIVLLVAFMRAFSGIEASASHAAEVDRPQKSYPLAILFVVLLGFSLNMLGSLSVGIVVPKQQISLLSGIMEAMSVFFAKFNLSGLVPVFGVLVAGGAIGGISTWVMGPVKGLHATALNGELPPFFQKTNRYGAPSNLLMLQAGLVSLIGGSLLYFMPNLNIAFWTSTAAAMLIYFVMYSLMILAALRLRYTQPKVKRAYRVPGGKFGIWAVSIIGLLTLFMGFVIALFPPAELPTGNILFYEIILICGITIIYAIPLIIYQFKSPDWKKGISKNDR
ncbi:MAG: APC family permease [bacterium]